MKIQNIDIAATINRAQKLIAEDQQMSEANKSMFEILILVITLLANRLGLKSTNKSKPPSSDLNRKKRQKDSVVRKAGGQQGHVGITLKKIDDPDKIGVTKAVQYGSGIKAHAVYMSQFQLIPYNRIQEYFADQMGVPIKRRIGLQFQQRGL